MTETVRSTAGDDIVLDTVGAGRPVVLVGGAMQLRETDTATRDLMSALAARGLRAVVYDRPGRGASTGGPTAAPGLPREIAALVAVCKHARRRPDGPVCVYGSSSGAAIALAAAARRPNLASDLVLWEPPLDADGGSSGADLVARLRDASTADDRPVDDVPYPASDRAERIVRAFMAGMPPEWFDDIRHGEHWPLYAAMAPTLIGDAEALAWTESEPRDRLWRGIRARTTVLVGADTLAFFGDAADSLVRNLPDARRATLPGGGHSWRPVDLADAIATAVS